jgi:hypothetical protein
MYLARMTLYGPPDQLLSATVLTDLLWSYARPEDHVQHIRVTSGSGWAKVTVFTSTADRRILESFFRKALRHSPTLAGWRTA